MTSKVQYVLKVDGSVMSVERDNPTDKNVWPDVKTEEFLTIAEMAEYLHAQLSVAGLACLKAVPTRKDMIMYHHGYGTYIRNTFGLWHPKNPLVLPGDLGDGHPDGISMRVLYALWDRVHDSSTWFDKG